MTRTKLPARTSAVTVKVTWRSPSSADHHILVTYQMNEAGEIRGAFCAGFRAGGDFNALANDASILLSRLLQHDDKLKDIAASLGEDRKEGELSGPPSSLIGAIARKGVELEDGHE